MAPAEKRREIAAAIWCVILLIAMALMIGWQADHCPPVDGPSTTRETRSER